MEITNTITPELYDTKSYYQFIGSITLEFKIKARFLSIHNQLKINFVKYKNIIQNLSEKNVIGPVISMQFTHRILAFDWLLNNRVWSGPVKSFAFKSKFKSFKIKNSNHSKSKFKSNHSNQIIQIIQIKSFKFKSFKSNRSKSKFK